MGIILDILILAIVILSIILGYKRGLVNLVFSLCATIVALIVTLILYIPITNVIIKNTEIDEGIQKIILDNGVINEDSDTNKKGDNSVNKYIEQYASEIMHKTTNNAIEATAKIISEKIVSIGVIIVLFVVLRIVLILLRFILSGITSLPIIKQFDKLGGTIYGIIRGAILVYAILAVLFLVISINNGGLIANAVDTSIVSKFLYENNMILNFIF